MSGITPLLDTLLHQVLGKRVDTAPPRDLNEPVRAVDPGEGPRALHSDSRLEGRRPATTPLPVTGAPQQRGEAPAGQADASRSPASIQTHFSPSARTIADLLVRFPAPPSVLSATSPLMALDEAPSATTLASRLQAGVRDSGLFYESHLSRWYRGEVSRQQLEREPQMLRTLRFSPPPTAPAATALGARGTAGPLAAAVSPGPLSTPLAVGGAPAQSQAAQAGTYAATGALLPGGAGNGQAAGGSGIATESTASPLRDSATTGRSIGAQAQAAGADAMSGREMGESLARARPAGGEAVHESLQGVVRHQLEMLVTPMLRWEGDVWSGIFMALMVQLPAGARRDGEEGDGGDDSESQPETWHSELQLRVPTLGDIRVAMWLRDTEVRLELKAHDDATLAILQRGIARLDERLRAAGLTKVLIDARLAYEEVADGGAGA